jgi:hypothetical protein
LLFTTLTTRIPGVELKEALSAGARISVAGSPAGATGDSAECRLDGLGDAIAAKASIAFLSRDIRIPVQVATDRQKSQNF